MRSTRRSRRAAFGRRNGFAAGYGDGYHLGRCEAIAKQSGAPLQTWRSWTVMYVAQGSPGFRSIDFGIIEALRMYVKDVLVAASGDPIDELAVKYRPDFVLVLNGLFSADVCTIDRIRAAGITTGVWIADDPYFTDLTKGIARHYDFVFTHEISCVPLYRNVGVRNVFYLPFGADPVLFKPARVDATFRTDICFIGMAFPNRIAFFDRIARQLADKRVLIAGGGWQAMASYGMLRDKIRLEGIDPKYAGAYYSGAKMVINLHRSALEAGNSGHYPGFSINPRTFEISACGTLQLVDSRAELPRHYVPGEEVETYSTPEELMEKIHRYLKDEIRRKDIAVKGLKRTMKSHTYRHRLADMLTILDSRGGVLK